MCVRQASIANLCLSFTVVRGPEPNSVLNRNLVKILEVINLFCMHEYS